MTGSASEIALVPYEQAYEAGFENMARRAPDIWKIQKLIGYRPILDLPEMLERVISYERDREQGAGAALSPKRCDTRVRSSCRLRCGNIDRIRNGPDEPE
jgi:hypothetical protein